MGNVHMEATQINYREGDKKMSVAEAIKNAGNTGLAHTADIAPEFSTESAYNAGDLVYHNDTLYVFTSNHSAGAWSTDDTQAVTVGGEITSLMSGLMNFVKSVEITGATNTNGNFNISISGRNKSNTSIIEIVGVRESPYYSEYYTITPAATSGSDSWTVKLVGDSAPLSQQDIKLIVRYVELS